MNIAPGNDLIPKWPIVEQAYRVGIVHAMDRPWRFMGTFDRSRIGAQCQCSTKHCKHRPVQLSHEEIMVHGRKAPVFLGQCKQCEFIYWGVPK